MPGFREILPPGFTLREGWVNELLQMPEADLSRPILGAASRRREFLAGRTCATLALRELGIEAGVLPAGPTGAPVWPPGFVGSISHTRHYCAAAAAPASIAAGVGIDVEVARPFSIGLLQTICTAREIAWWADQTEVSQSLLFSAKESTFKALFPFAKEAWALREIDLDLNLALGSFTASAHRDAALQRVLVNAEGTFRIHGGYVFSALWIRHTEKPEIVQ